MKIWLLSIGEPLPCDGQGDRLWRTGLLAQALLQKGHEVCWWTSTFHHKEKRQRCDQDENWDYHPRCVVRMLHAKSYRRNISLGRFWNHRELARKFRKLAAHLDPPDLIVSSLPTLDFCFAATEYGRQLGVPVVLDVRDLWPDIFQDAAPGPLRPLARRLLGPLQERTRRACANATAITGITKEFVAWGLEKANRSGHVLDHAFPMGYAQSEPTTEEICEAQGFWESKGISAARNEFLLCFFGTLGRHFEHQTVMQAAEKLAKTNRPFRLVVCGSGPAAPEWQKLASSLPNVTLPGWVSAAQIWTLMRLSSAALAPYYSTHDFARSLPNKSIEYLSAGLPILSSLQGSLAELLLQNDCGVTYGNGQAQQLTDAVVGLYHNPTRRQAMSTNAKRLYQRSFVAEKVYAQMADHLMQVALSGRVSARAA